jgi:hypothetical protein
VFDASVQTPTSSASARTNSSGVCAKSAIRMTAKNAPAMVPIAR